MKPFPSAGVDPGMFALQLEAGTAARIDDDSAISQGCAWARRRAPTGSVRMTVVPLALKRLEHDLEERCDFLATLVDSMGVGVYAIDGDGLCAFLNAEAERLIGWTYAEVEGKPLHEIVQLQDFGGDPGRGGERAFRRGLADHGAYRSEEDCFTDRGGRRFPVSIVARPMARNDERRGAVVVFQDIRARRRVHDRMRLSEERLNIALGASSTGLWDLDPIADRAYYSDTCFRMLGHEPMPAANGRDLFVSLIHPDDRDAWDRALEEHLRDRSEPLECEFRMRRADGQWAWIRSIGKVVEVEGDGRPKRIVGVHVDTTASHAARAELAAAKDEAIRANQAKSDFLATMSHEIRTPMNAIIGLSHLLERTDLSGRQRDLLSKIQDASRGLLSIINDILDFSKIEAGKLTIEDVEFNLDQVVDSVLTMIGPKVAEKGLSLILVRAPDLPAEFVGDPLRLSQLMLNLLSNAAKFTARGEIRVELEGRPLPDGRCQLAARISDTGIGMTEQQMASLFRPFTQADASTWRRFGGTGLGLVICRQLLNLMGGDISVSSVEGKGTTFSFVAPLRLATPATLDEGDAAALEDKRVLVVDDSPSARRVLRAGLARLGFRVDEAETAAEAMAKLRSPGGYDLITLDGKLPDESAVAALARLRTLDTRQPVVLITAQGRSELEAEIAQRFPETPPGVLLLEKPISPTALRECVLEAFGLRAPGGDGRERAKGAASDMALRGVRVLLVEDNSINQHVATGLLEALGVETTVASSGEQALEILAVRRFDAILMDMRMPGKDGPQTTVAIRTELGIVDTPIIAMTASAMARDRERCLASGMNDHIAKPIDPGALALVLAKWLERSGVEVAPPAPPVARDPAREAMAPASPPGLDVQAALDHLGGNEELLMRLLAMFVEGHAGDAARIGAAIEADERRLASSLSHALKGAASTLGAQRVAEIALAIETATRPDAEQHPPADLKRATAALGIALAEAIESMQAVVQTAKDEPERGEAPPPDREDAIAAIDALAQLLSIGDADAEPGSERLAEMFAGAPRLARAKAKAVAASAGRYDFEEARSLLAKLRESVAEWC